MNAILTIVIPIYNVEQYLRKCLDSLVNQTRTDFKVFLVNDGTKDNSEAIIDEYVLDYPDIFKSFIKENGGLSDARNYGLKFVDTPYVAFIDSDDFVESTFVEDSLTKIIEDESDILVFSYNQYHLSTNTKEVINLKREGVFNPRVNKELLTDTPNAAWNKIYKTCLFKDNGIEYPFGLFYEDLGTTPRLLIRANKITFLNKPLYNYLIDRPGNISRDVSKRILELNKSFEFVIVDFKKNSLFDEYASELKYLYTINQIDNLRKCMKSSNKDVVYEFIDKTFAFKEDQFKKVEDIYKINLSNIDKIYINKLACKAYYMLRGGKNNG